MSSSPQLGGEELLSLTVTSARQGNKITTQALRPIPSSPQLSEEELLNLASARQENIHSPAEKSTLHSFISLIPIIRGSGAAIKDAVPAAAHPVEVDVGVSTLTHTRRSSSISSTPPAKRRFLVLNHGDSHGSDWSDE